MLSFFKVLKIVSPVEFYVDFNENFVADIDELVTLDDLDTDSDEYSHTDVLRLNYLALKYAEKNLLNKNIKVFSDINGKTSVILPDNKDYKNLLINEGLVFAQNNKNKVKKNIEYAKTLDLGGRYNISLECSNLLDKLAYDNYKLQKPGRAFFAKFRLFIN